jgi:hypothetical protein
MSLPAEDPKVYRQPRPGGRRESKNRRKRPKILADPIERVRRYPQNYPQSEATAHRAAQVRSDIMPEVIRLVETSNGGQWRAAVKAR